MSREQETEFTEFQGLTESESLCFLAMVHSLHSSPQPRQCWSQPSPNPRDSTGQSVLLSLPYMDNEHLPISSPQVALCVCVCVVEEGGKGYVPHDYFRQHTHRFQPKVAPSAPDPEMRVLGHAGRSCLGKLTVHRREPAPVSLPATLGVWRLPFGQSSTRSVLFQDATSFTS